MSLDSALKFAKNASAEKVPFRFQFPIDTKEEFEKLCQKHNVSLTDMILGLINSAIDEDNGLTNSSIVNIINKLEELEKEYYYLDELYRKTGDSVLECANGEVVYIEDGMDKIQFKMNVLNKELKRRMEQ